MDADGASDMRVAGSPRVCIEQKGRDSRPGNARKSCTGIPVGNANRKLVTGEQSRCKAPWLKPGLVRACFAGLKAHASTGTARRLFGCARPTPTSCVRSRTGESVRGCGASVRSGGRKRTDEIVCATGRPFTYPADEERSALGRRAAPISCVRLDAARRSMSAPFRAEGGLDSR